MAQLDSSAGSVSCRQLLESMFEWLVPPMLRVATRMVRAPVPMQDLNLVASCMRLLDALLLPEFRDSPQLIADMNDNVQMVSQPSIAAANMVVVHTQACCVPFSRSGRDMWLCIASLHCCASFLGHAVVVTWRKKKINHKVQLPKLDA